MDNSAIQYSKGGTVFTGDAIQLYRATMLQSFIKLYVKCGMIPTRGVTISRMLQEAQGFTGKPYVNNARGRIKAIEDLALWCDTLKAALPQLNDNGEQI